MNGGGFVIAILCLALYKRQWVTPDYGLKNMIIVLEDS